MQLDLFPTNNSSGSGIALEELFDAYIACRHNKRWTHNAISFELDYEEHLVNLLTEINAGVYLPGRSIAFIIDRPVKREIFAADFRDRIVHHLLINKLNPLFEKDFIRDSYACRVGKGTYYGVKRLDGFIRKCSRNYSKDCFILKLDIAAFFMHIDRNLLFQRLRLFIFDKYYLSDREIIIELVRKVIFYDPVKQCLRKSPPADWADLPKSKSLFYAPADCGLPIGNLTSQVFANFYMNLLDHFVKHTLRFKYYGRYVDDFVLVHNDKEYLKSTIPVIKDFLAAHLKLELHPDKIYLQHFSKGVKYLGVVIKPNRLYIANRTKGNFYRAIIKHNKITDRHKPDKSEIANAQCSFNSSLGIMKHYKTFKIRKRLLDKILSSRWKQRLQPDFKYEKVVRQ